MYVTRKQEQNSHSSYMGPQEQVQLSIKIDFRVNSYSTVVLSIDFIVKTPLFGEK